MAAKDINFPTDWRYASRRVKFWKVDYRLSFFVLFFILHMRLTTFYLILGAMAILWIIEFRFQYRVEAVFKRLFCFIVGKSRPSVTSRRMNRTDR